MKNNIISSLSHIADRFKEPSSWAGIGAFAVMMGYHLDPGFAQGLAYLGAGIASVIAFFVPED